MARSKAAAALNRLIDPHLAQGFESCMDDEEAAHCLNQTMHEEDQSYVAVLECLHLALGIDPPTPTLRGAKNRHQKSPKPNGGYQPKSSPQARA